MLDLDWGRNRLGEQSHIPEFNWALESECEDLTSLRQTWDGVGAGSAAVEFLGVLDVSDEPLVFVGCG